MKKKSKAKNYVSLDVVKCPICKGVINEKWFNFRTDNTIEFIAECWTPKNPDLPRHVFYFQIDVNPCVLFDKKGKQFTADGSKK